MAATTISTTTIDVATAVAAEINAPVSGTEWLDSGFVCQRKWLPSYTPAELAANIRITVVPISEKAKRIARKLTERDHLVELWMQKTVSAIPATRETAVTDLAAFAFQVKDYFLAAHRVLSTLANVHVTESEVDACYSPKDLAENNLWVGVIRLMLQERTNQ